MGWKQSLLYTVCSRRFVDSLKAEPRLIKSRLLCLSPWNLAAILRLRKQASLQLNIGAGEHVVAGWNNIDLVNSRHGFRWDLRWRIPLKDCSVSKIHCEHVLEHLDYPDEALKFLNECHRLLRTDGELRLIIPDVLKYIQAYTGGNFHFWDQFKDLGNTAKPFETEMEIINQCFRMGGDHRFAYDYKTVNTLLTKAGFVHIKKTDYCPGNFLDQGDSWRLSESLYLTVTKENDQRLQKAG
ncbi:MAG: methyltransferase domain-containing protein [Deltaproteobacteria bacterium]|nr:methyltransferase domain-containing protein [Deltaproteobacteria bacterium]